MQSDQCLCYLHEDMFNIFSLSCIQQDEGKEKDKKSRSRKSKSARDKKSKPGNGSSSKENKDNSERKEVSETENVDPELSEGASLLPLKESGKIHTQV